MYLFTINEMKMNEWMNKTLSFPGRTDITRPSFQWIEVVLSSCTMTISPNLIFGFCFVHLERCCKVTRYFTFQLFQMFCIKPWTSYHRLDIFQLTSWRHVSGNVTKGPPTKKCHGLRSSKSVGSSEIEIGAVMDHNVAIFHVSNQ